MMGMRYRRGESIDCEAKKPMLMTKDTIRKLSLVVSTAALALVARSGVHDGLVDLPLGTGLVTRFGLYREKGELV